MAYEQAFHWVMQSTWVWDQLHLSQALTTLSRHHWEWIALREFSASTRSCSNSQPWLLDNICGWLEEPNSCSLSHLSTWIGVSGTMGRSIEASRDEEGGRLLWKSQSAKLPSLHKSCLLARALRRRLKKIASQPHTFVKDQSPQILLEVKRYRQIGRLDQRRSFLTQRESRKFTEQPHL